MVCKEDFSGFWLNSFYKKEDKFLCFHRQLRSAQIWSQTDIGGNLVKHNEEGKFALKACALSLCRQNVLSNDC